MAEFIRADIGKLESFITESEEAIREFSAIRTEFDRINRDLLANWDGLGKSAYSRVSGHITEKIGGIQDILNTINDTIVKDLVSQYNEIDKSLGEYNRTAGDKKEGSE